MPWKSLGGSGGNPVQAAAQIPHAAVLHQERLQPLMAWGEGLAPWVGVPGLELQKVLQAMSQDA